MSEEVFVSDESENPSVPGFTFKELNLNPQLLEAIEKSGYTTPTPIQAGAIPPLLEGRDVLGQAQTGTGKTGAFAIPMLQRVDISLNQPQVLVLAPTRELAIQVAEAFERYADSLRGLRVVPIYGGQAYPVQLQELRRGVHVVVGTPGRVMDHIRRGSLKLDNLRGLVLDEADEMLQMGFAEDVEWILQQSPPNRQIALFSATMPSAIREIAHRHLRNPAEITIQQKTATAETITQKMIGVAQHQKETLLAQVLEVEPVDGVIVFVRTKSSTEPLAEMLARHGHRTAALNGDIPQAQRERIIDHLREGRIDIIIATDVAARGLDVRRVSHVINYDMPIDTESYVHRIGRTGRAGREGTAILFMTPRERGMLQRIERVTRKRIEPMPLPTKRDINENRVNRFHQRITKALEHHEVETFASVIQQYQTQFPETSIEQIAAALAVMAAGDAPLLVSEELRAIGGPRDDRSRPQERRSFEGNGDRPPRPNGRPERARGESMETYRIDVGRMHQIRPANIVGAIANEGGVAINAIGRIEIYEDFSTVDLLVGMPPDTFQALKAVRVAGRRLNISRLQEAPAGGDDRRSGSRFRSPAGKFRAKRPAAKL